MPLLQELCSAVWWGGTSFTFTQSKQRQAPNAICHASALMIWKDLESGDKLHGSQVDLVQMLLTSCLDFPHTQLCSQPFYSQHRCLTSCTTSHSLSLMNKVKKTLPVFSSLTLKYSFWLRLSPYRLCAWDYLHVFSRPATYKLSSTVSHVPCSLRAAPMKWMGYADSCKPPSLFSAGWS